MLICALNVDGEKMNPNFIDVDNNEWYAEYIFRAYCAGIVKGIDEKRFGIVLRKRQELYLIKSIQKHCLRIMMI